MRKTPLKKMEHTTHDLECQYCLYYQGKGKACVRKTCCCEEEKQQALKREQS